MHRTNSTRILSKTRSESCECSSYFCLCLCSGRCSTNRFVFVIDIISPRMVEWFWISGAGIQVDVPGDAYGRKTGRLCHHQGGPAANCQSVADFGVGADFRECSVPVVHQVPFADTAPAYGHRRHSGRRGFCHFWNCGAQFGGFLFWYCCLVSFLRLVGRLVETLWDLLAFRRYLMRFPA